MRYWNDETIKKIRHGYYSAVYFNRTKYILEQEKNLKTVTMQVFQKKEGSVLCGVEEVVELFRVGTGYLQKNKWIDKSGEIKIESLSDGDKTDKGEIVMHITGPYVYFAHLESLYLGILARRSLVATNTRRVIQVACGKPVIFFADRFDYFLNQEGDGYAARIGGAEGVCTEALGAGFGWQAIGTIPHALIAVNNGNTVEAAKKFAKHIKDAKVIVLVDYENDCVKTSLEAAKALGDKLWGVRLDTAENLIDRSLFTRSVESAEVGMAFLRTSQTRPSVSSGLKHGGRAQKAYLPADSFGLYGVNPTLVGLVRKALDGEGFGNVKIVVSGGFNEEKIKWFEQEKAPVDVYGVGSALVHGQNDFTADIVKVEGKLIAKVGREYRSNSRLKIVN